MKRTTTNTSVKALKPILFIAFFAMVVSVAKADDNLLVYSGNNARMIMAQMARTGGARVITGDERDAAGNIVRRYYRDVTQVYGWGKLQNGQYEAIVASFDVEKHVDATAVYQYPIYYRHPTTGAWTFYTNTTDWNQANRINTWLQTTYRLSTYCQPSFYQWQIVDPPVVQINKSNTAATTTTTGSTGGNGILGVPMGDVSFDGLNRTGR